MKCTISEIKKYNKGYNRHNSDKHPEQNTTWNYTQGIVLISSIAC